MQRLLPVFTALALLAACQSTTTTSVATAPAGPPLTDDPNAVTVPFQFVDEGSTGTLTVSGQQARYTDEYCGGMSTDTGVVEGTTITFERMVYPQCGKPEELWADIVVTGYEPETGCFDQLRFKWGYNFVRTYYAYPTAEHCRDS